MVRADLRDASPGGVERRAVGRPGSAGWVTPPAHREAGHARRRRPVGGGAAAALWPRRDGPRAGSQRLRPVGSSPLPARRWELVPSQLAPASRRVAGLGELGSSGVRLVRRSVVRSPRPHLRAML